jgi:threonine dehydrogenase-like Zn-dependent dehydrogenase
MQTAIKAARPGARVGYVGVPHDIESPFDLTLPMSESAEGYRAMDERRAIKVLLEP